MAKINGKDVTLEEKQKILKTQAIIHAENLYHYKLIAKASGITDDTLKTYRDEDKEFSVELEQSRVRFLQKKIKAARPEFLLERLEPEIFKERTENKTEITVPTPIMNLNNAVLRNDSNSQDSQPDQED